jgi:hypothetical protein
MATIIPFVRDSYVFEPEVTQMMASAYDAVCGALKLNESAARERETVATRIVELVRRGERDLARLSERVLGEANGASAAATTS